MAEQGNRDNFSGGLIGEIRQSLMTGIWFCLVTMPLLVVRVNVSNRSVSFRWMNLLWIFIGVFFGSWAWRKMIERRDRLQAIKNRPLDETEGDDEVDVSQSRIDQRIMASKYRSYIIAAFFVVMAVFPFLVSTFQVSIIITGLIYITLGLGLNIVVGVAGLLNLGYAAFYAIGAYTYALLFHYYGFGFWTCLPLGAIAATIFGLLLGIPILRLRGDYLAIVTLGFAEILRLVLENWSSLTNGPGGYETFPVQVSSGTNSSSRIR